MHALVMQAYILLTYNNYIAPLLESHIHNLETVYKRATAYKCLLLKKKKKYGLNCVDTNFC